jgi:hypothetical protein
MAQCVEVKMAVMHDYTRPHFEEVRCSRSTFNAPLSGSPGASITLPGSPGFQLASALTGDHHIELDHALLFAGGFQRLVLPNTCCSNHDETPSAIRRLVIYRVVLVTDAWGSSRHQQ